MRQVAKKWPVNCSRSCAKKLQHQKNHSSKRVVKKCETCEEEFYIAIWNRSQKYCSQKCSLFARFGEPKKRIAELRKKVEKIINDEKYMNFIKRKAIKISSKYGVDYNDILQDYFLHLCEGHNSFIEQTSMDVIRREYNRGICGKRKAKDCLVNTDILEHIREKENFLDSFEFKEYLIDIEKTADEYELKLINLALCGFGRTESNNKLKGSNEKFSRTWNFIIKGEQENSPYTV